MKPYTKQFLENLKTNTHLKLEGKNKEVIGIFFKDEDNINDETPFIIKEFGITYPDSTYKIIREFTTCFTLEYVLEGEGRVELENETFDVKKGDVYFLYPHTKQKYYSKQDNPFLKYWINFECYEMVDLIKALKIKDIHHFPDTDIKQLFEQLFSLEQVSKLNKNISYQAYSIILQMLVKMKKELASNKSKANTKTNEISKAKKFIDSNLANKLSIDEICKYCGISKTGLITKFKKAYLETPMQYHTRKRIELAASMIITTTYSIGMISSSLGFDDQYNFTHAFIKRYGRSPTIYRKEAAMIAK